MLTAADVVRAIQANPTVYEDEAGRRVVGCPVSDMPNWLRRVGWRRVSHLNHSRDYTHLGLEVIRARYIEGVRPKQYCLVVVAAEATRCEPRCAGASCSITHCTIISSKWRTHMEVLAEG